ncbi:IST1 homolog isoform X2 [Xenia sp. Carnegie-2017]|uniref:IST1 homolog isoform X2 n=1 Tax=Xenia sp. Carnegie-2017 TaxID=2897299 RepID=UPI001F0437A3|nr:IST1 homolog isoform X2 [Xenia sp. Carnegie-2017]
MGFRPQKLRVNLKLSINRLKLLEKKKTEMALKSRKEIADYLSQNKDDRARIRVEHIIREDYLVEAMELLELYCDLLLARFGLIETMKYCEDGLVEPVSTLIWVAPRLQSDVQELKLVADQLSQKYGKQFAEESARNTNKTVNEKLITKLSPNAPPKSLVERYLVEIAKNYNVPYEPDESALGELSSSEKESENSNNFNSNSGFGGPSGPSGGGRVVLLALNVMKNLDLLFLIKCLLCPVQTHPLPILHNRLTNFHNLELCHIHHQMRNLTRGLDFVQQMTIHLLLPSKIRLQQTINPQVPLDQVQMCTLCPMSLTFLMFPLDPYLVLQAQLVAQVVMMILTLMTLTEDLKN